MTVLQPVVIALTMVLILWAHRQIVSLEPTLVPLEPAADPQE
jgi:hypothetical protein